MLRNGKALAALQGISLSRMVSDKLTDAIQEKEAYARAKKKGRRRRGDGVGNLS